MARITLLILVAVSLASCGGGGGGGGSTPAPPKVSVSGPSAVWSDDMDWSAKATASGMDLSTVGFTISGGDEYIEIDSITGAINSSGYNVDIGSHRFTIEATDSAGVTASTTYSLRSDAFIAGSWESNSTPYGTYFRMDMTRSGQIFTQSSAEGGGMTCSGKVAITGSIVDGKIDCRDYEGEVERGWSADIEAISDGYNFTINKMSITSGEYAGMVVDESESYYRTNNSPEKVNIPPGLYFTVSNAMGYQELRVNADGSFNTASEEDAILELGSIFTDMTYSTCRVSGTITADPVYGLTTQASGTYSQVANHDSIFSASNCSTDLDQSRVAAVAWAQIDNYNDVYLVFGTPGNAVLNNGYRPMPFSVVRVCDEFDQSTSLGLLFNLTCTGT